MCIEFPTCYLLCKRVENNNVHLSLHKEPLEGYTWKTNKTGYLWMLEFDYELGRLERYIVCFFERYKYIYVCICIRDQSCLTHWDPKDCSPPVSSIQGVSQERILEWIFISSSTGSSKPRDKTRVSCVSCIAGGCFSAVTGEAP